MDIIKIIKRNNIFKKEHILILHRDKASKTNLSENIKIVEKRVYGRSEIFFLSFFWC